MDYYEFCKRYSSILLAGIISIPIFLILTFLGLDKILPLYIFVVLWGVFVVVVGVLLYPILKKKKLL
ncbi:MAG: hypothetical protein KAJ44_07210 [Thermoplasmatales archaeon]|nr:hypothetical protein [Thermoplasmatales archaeon]